MLKKDSLTIRFKPSNIKPFPFYLEACKLSKRLTIYPETKTKTKYYNNKENHLLPTVHD